MKVVQYVILYDGKFLCPPKHIVMFGRKFNAQQVGCVDSKVEERWLRVLQDLGSIPGEYPEGLFREYLRKFLQGK